MQRIADETALWKMILSGAPIDASDFAKAIEREIAEKKLDNLDFRTRLLIRDGMNTLADYWGKEKLADWRSGMANRSLLDEIEQTDLGPAGFSLLARHIMEFTRPEAIDAFLRELGERCPRPASLRIGGAIALILSGMLSRHTDDLDIVNEVPVVLRNNHALLDELAARYRLQLTHFQSHYLPTDWETRLRSHGRFGKLDVFLIDPVDIFVGKLFSGRMKDRDDLRILAGRLDKSAVEDRLKTSGGALRADAKLAKLMADNWYIVYGKRIE